MQQRYRRVVPFDQTTELSNHFCGKGCESLVLICEFSAGRGISGRLGVVGNGVANVKLQACNGVGSYT